MSARDDPMPAASDEVSADANTVRGRTDGVSAAEDDMSVVHTAIWVRADRSGVPGS